MSRAQTTIELLLVLSVSFVALAIIYSIYSEQIFSANDSKSQFMAKSAIQKVVDSANSVYYSGKGSQAKIFVEFPADTNFSATMLLEKTFLFSLSKNRDYFGSADIELTGRLPSSPGKHSLLVYYDGNSVIISPNDFELNKESFFVSLTQGAYSEQAFTVRNNTDTEIEVVVENYFNHSLAELSLGDGDDYFLLEPFGIRVIDINFISSSLSNGNYAGRILVIANISDVNYSKEVLVSLESFLEVGEITVYPKNTLISSSPLSEEQSSFSVCNSSSSEISGLSWTKNDSDDFIDSLPSVASLPAFSCTDFNLDFTIGSLPYDADFSVNYNDSNSYKAYISFVQE